MTSSDYFVVRKGATAVPNSLIHDRDLSYAALALALVSLSMPAGARVGYRQLKGRGLGEAATRKALAELEGRGLRFRFRTRVEGKIRDLTVVSDTPLSVDEAYGEILARLGRRAMRDIEVLECVSHPDEAGVVRPADVHNETGLSTGRDVTGNTVERRAVPSTARCDQHEYPDEEPGACEGESLEESYPQGDGDVSEIVADIEHAGQGSDQQEQSVCAGRTVQRSTVARSAVAHISKDISKPSLRDGNNNQPTSLRERERSPGGVVGGHSSDPPGGGDELAGVVPAGMLALLGGRARARVVDVVRGAVGRGWTSGQIHQRLAANPLPPVANLRNPEGFVIHRVSDGLAGLPPASNRRMSATERKAHDAAALRELADGVSGLTVREQFLRINTLASKNHIQADPELSELAERVYRRVSAAHEAALAKAARAAADERAERARRMREVFATPSSGESFSKVSGSVPVSVTCGGESPNTGQNRVKTGALSSALEGSIERDQSCQ